MSYVGNLGAFSLPNVSINQADLQKFGGALKEGGSKLVSLVQGGSKAQAAPASEPPPPLVPEESKTPLFIAGGVAVLVVGGLLVWKMKK